MPIAISVSDIGIDYGQAITILAWRAREGEPVERDQVLLEVETAKSTIEILSPADGVLARIDAQTGREWDLRHPVGFILLEEEDPSSLPPRAGGSEDRGPDHNSEPTSVDSIREGRRKKGPVSPRARRLALELGVDLQEIRPSRTSGRITESDVRQHVEAVDSRQRPSGLPPGRLVEIGARRGAIARHMTESSRQAATVTLHADAAGGHSLKRLEVIDRDTDSRSSPALSDLVILAAATALRTHPYLNAAFLDHGIWLYDAVNIGVAVHHEEGLLVPVIRNADALSLREVARRRRELQDTILAGRTPAESDGRATFTISNLGDQGIRYFTPILQKYTVAILGIGSTYAFSTGRSHADAWLPLSLTFDHRVVDGLPAAAFLQSIIALIASTEPWPSHWEAMRGSTHSDHRR
jgi:pyruvate dehydrogenase E2 component (dihydrolipoamide acetyltransferase)